MAIRIDPSLTQASGGPTPGRLGGVEPPVVRAGVATSGPFLLEGARVAVTGRERTGEHTVWVGGAPVVANLGTDAGACVNVVSGPATLRRELLGPLATTVETTLAAPALPLVAVQWEAPAGGRWTGGLQVAFSVLPRERDVRYLVEGDALRAVAAGAPERAVEVRLHPAPVEWVVVEGEPGGLGVRATVAGESPVTLLVGAGDRETAARAVAAAPHLGAHEIRAAADADPANLDLLGTTTGVPDLDHGVVWASARLRAGLGRGPAPSGEAAFWSGLGALAVGDEAAAHAALTALRGGGEGPVAWARGGTVPGRALATLLAARHTLVTGDGTPARQALADLSPDAVAALCAASEEAGWAVWSLALSTLADALRHGASDEEIQALRSAATLPAGRVVRLPMLGASGPAGPARLLRELLEGGAVLNGAARDPEPDTPLGSWARFVSGDADGGYAAWRSLLAQGLSGDSHGRGCWDPVTAPPGGAPQAGLLLCGLVHGLLGVVPDAPSGRIRVAPALPGHLTAFEVRGVRLGEARMTLRVTREGRLHRFRLEPTRGRVPPMVILEPSLPCAGVGATRVDGADAELERRREGGRTRVRVQLPLDGPRTLEVEEAE